MPLFQSESSCKILLMKISLICRNMNMEAELILIYELFQTMNRFDTGKRLGNDLLHFTEVRNNLIATFGYFSFQKKRSVLFTRIKMTLELSQVYARGVSMLLSLLHFSFYFYFIINFIISLYCLLRKVFISHSIVLEVLLFINFYTRYSRYSFPTRKTTLRRLQCNRISSKRPPL